MGRKGRREDNNLRYTTQIESLVGWGCVCMWKRTTSLVIDTAVPSFQTTPLHRPLRGCYSGRDVTPEMEDWIQYAYLHLRLAP